MVFTDEKLQINLNSRGVRRRSETRVIAEPGSGVLCLKTVTSLLTQRARLTVGIDDLATKDDEEIRENRRSIVIYFYYSLLSLNYFDYRLFPTMKT